VVVSPSDVVALRRALLVEHVRPGIPLVVTIFGRGVAEQVAASVENVRVVSMGEIAAPCLAGPLLDPELVAIVEGPNGPAAVAIRDDSPRLTEVGSPGPGLWRRLLSGVSSLLWPFDASARILVVGVLGVVLVLLVEAALMVMALGAPILEAIYAAVKATVTVGPNPFADRGPEWFKLVTSVAMLLVLGFTAVFTAGLVNRLLDRRLTGIVGRRAVPRRDHVVVVGLGQVGFRLCLLLRRIGVPVVAVERDADVPNVLRAKDIGIPVVIGRGTSQMLLGRLALERARGLAAVTSEEVENIAIAVAAKGLREDLHIALRAGDADASRDVRALFGIGVVRDAYRVAGTTLAAAALGSTAREAFPYEGTIYLVEEEGRIEAFETSDR
jgi:Trk K+ transport system NAD-binding subunit